MYFGIGKNFLAVFVLDAVDVVGMEMRNQDRVDRIGIDAGAGKILGKITGGRGELAGGAAVDKNEF